MDSPKSKRSPGVILTRSGWQKFDNARRELEYQENSGEHMTIDEISERTGLTTATLTRVFARQDGVDKLTLASLFGAFGLDLQRDNYTRSSPLHTEYQEWGEAVDASLFCGRTEELATLKQWILKERCRVVALLGIGGVGRSALAAKLGEQIRDKFEYALWRDLSYAPYLGELLDSFMQFLSGEQEQSRSIGRKVSKLIRFLQEHRCLLVLDNLQVIMKHGELAGRYRRGYEGYGEFIRRVAELPHLSSLILISREKPEEIAFMEGDSLPVRVLELRGVHTEAAQILSLKGLRTTPEEWEALTKRYAGSPTALKMVASTIRDVFEGDIAEFLRQEATIFGDVCKLVQRQFWRLSGLERDIMYWLAIHGEPAEFEELERAFIASAVPQKDFLEALESLRRRSMVEKTASHFMVQPLVMEYLTN